MTEDVLCKVIDYLTVVDRVRLKGASAHVDKETRKKVGYLRLNINYSLEYISNPNFREEVLTRIANPKKQLALKFSAVAIQQTMNKKKLLIIANIHAFSLFGSLLELHQREDNECVFDLVGKCDYYYFGEAYTSCWLDMRTEKYYVRFFMHSSL